MQPSLGFTYLSCIDGKCYYRDEQGHKPSGSELVWCTVRAYCIHLHCNYSLINILGNEH